MKQLIFILFFTVTGPAARSQNRLAVTDQRSGLKLIVVNKQYPLLKLLLPDQPETDRGIEIEFPEHVTGLNLQSKDRQHLYLVTSGTVNRRTLPQWKVSANTISYETVLNSAVKLIASATLDPTGVRYRYRLINLTDTAYQHLQAVTCVQLYSQFSDTLLERCYVHDKNGFTLLAAETPGRLSMPLNKWLPCRYLVSYTWPVPDKRVEKDEDGITRYYRSVKADKPFIATLSHNKKWVAATYTGQTGNMWTNPERSCHHADPETALAGHETKTLELGTFVYRGPLERLLQYAAE